MNENAREYFGGLNESPLSEGATLRDLQWFTTDITQKIGEAYNAALTLKGSMDSMNEIPGYLLKVYRRNNKVMSLLAKAKQEAYQSQMEMRRMR